MSKHAIYHTGKELEIFPKDFEDSDTLEILEISHNRISEIPDVIGDLKNLRIFNAVGNSFTVLPESLGRIPCLEELRFLWTPLRELPASLSGHPALRELNLRGTALTELPEDFKPMPELRALDLRDLPRMEVLPAWIADCPRLSVLKLSRSPLRALPATGSDAWRALTDLSLLRIPLRELPAQIGELPSLSRLDISGCGLVRLPGGAEAFKGLTELTLDASKLESLPPWIRDHGKLEWLSAQGTDSLYWTQELHLPAARVIRLSDCGLKAVPSWLRQCRELRTLVLENNRLQELPTWLSELPRLLNLHVYGNDIRELPRALVEKPGLKVTRLPQETVNEAKGHTCPDWLEELRTPRLPIIPGRRRTLMLKPGENNGPRINATIQEMSGQGGGTIELPAGTWPTGPIQLQSGINLHLSEGCHLLFSDHPEDYLPAQFVWWDSLPCLNYHPLIYAHRAKDISLTGKGTIDGNHEAWLDWKFREERASQTLYRANARGIPATERVFATQEAALRPQLVHLLDCERVLLSEYTARRSPFWNHHIALCREVTARNITLQNPPRTPNTDGFNLDACLDCLVEDLHADVGDDAICLKAGINEDAWSLPHGCERVHIRNCSIRHGHGGIVFGSATGAGIRKILVEDCEMEKTERGIRMKSMRGRGGEVCDILIRNCRMEDIAGEAIEISSHYGSSTAGNVTSLPPHFRRITVKKITCEHAGTAASVCGLPEAPIEDLRLEQVELRGQNPPRFQSVGSMTCANVCLQTPKTQKRL